MRRDCPSDLPQLAQTYVEWALKREAPQPELGLNPRGGRIASPHNRRGPRPRLRSCPGAGRVSPPVAAAPKAARIEPKPGGCPPCTPAATPAPAPKTAVAQPAATATVPHVEEQPAPDTPAGPRVEEQAANPATATPPPPQPRLLPGNSCLPSRANPETRSTRARFFRRREASPSWVRPRARSPADWPWTCPAMLFAEATKLETLQRALPHYQVSGARTEEARTVVTAQPLFIRASGLTIKIACGGVENVSGCELALDVFKIRRLGACLAPQTRRACGSARREHPTRRTCPAMRTRARC